MNIYSEHFLDRLTNGGMFLTAKADDKVNTMTIGWGSISHYWNRDILIVPVRFSRYTHDLMEIVDTFTVSVPKSDELKKELIYCGTKSGRDVDKFTQLGLDAVDAKRVDTPIIKQAYLHYECKIVGKYNMLSDSLSDEVDDKFYSSNDYHTMYYGEIVACYITD